MAEPQRVGPGLPPLYNARSRALILGSFPSPKSRAQGFFYGHPQNRFWPLLAALTGEPKPDWADVESKKAIILNHGLALWDSIERCVITGASDASIREVVPNRVPELVARCGIRAVLCNGAASWRLYEKYLAEQTGIHAVQLPSTSPANAACTLAMLQTAWGAAIKPFLTEK